MAKVECPFGGCDFAGSVSSVEGHISGSTSGDHQGEVGRNHREYLTREAEEKIKEEELPESVVSPAPSGSSSPGRRVLLGTMLLVVVVLASTIPEESEQPEEIEPDQGGATAEEWVV